MPTPFCHCGFPLHYSNPRTQQAIEAVVSDLGEFICASYKGRTWLVPRHYIALHGLKASDLPSLGFEEVV